MTTVGDSTIPSTPVRPAGDDTGVTLLVIRGDDTTIPVPLVMQEDEGLGVDRQQIWQATESVPYTVPGEWIFRFISTGTGADVADITVMVAPSGASSTRRAYATTTDWANHTGEAPPAGARQKLIEASDAVDDMLFGAYYLTDGDGLPIEQAAITAMREATIAQAADTVTEAKAAAGAGSFSIGKLSVTRPTPAASVAAPRAGVFYSAAAWRVLQRAGMLGHAPWTS